MSYSRSCLDEQNKKDLAWAPIFLVDQTQTYEFRGQELESLRAHPKGFKPLASAFGGQGAHQSCMRGIPKYSLTSCMDLGRISAILRKTL